MFKEILKSLSGALAGPATFIDQDALKGGIADAYIVTHHSDVAVTDISKHVRDAMTIMEPARRKGIARLYSPESVCAFVNRHYDAGSVIFVDPGDVATGGKTGPHLKAVINYHLPGAETFHESSLSDQARYGDFGAIYDFPMTEPFKAWLRASNSAFSQAGLSDFVMDRVEDFEEPTPALSARDPALVSFEWETRLLRLADRYGSRFGGYRDLMALSQSFEVNENSTLRIARNPTSGETRFEFKNEHTGPGGAAIDVPTLYVANVQVYSGGPLYPVPVRLSYRKEGGKVVFYLSIARLPDVLMRATEELVEAIKGGLEAADRVPIFWGRDAA